MILPSSIARARVGVERLLHGPASPTTGGRRWFRMLPFAALLGVPFLVREALPRWVFMWMLAGSLYAASKWLVYCSDTKDQPGMAASTRLLFLFGWVGMSLREFAGKPVVQAAPAQVIPGWLPPLAKTGLGAFLLWAITPAIPVTQWEARAWTGMVGAILMLHFGTFHLLALALRRAGYDARVLMRKPLCAGSLTEFWGTRWNTAFHALADRFVFRPLAPVLGAGGALIATFVVSGLVHEAVITVPAGGGYGLPTLYFTVQALGSLLERARWFRRSPRVRRVFAWMVLLGPVPALFPPVFLQRVILPMLQAIGAT